MDFQLLHSLLQRDHKVALLYVISSNGSSPGRAGFGMFVTAEGDMNGSIGGGFMEHKLVEFAKSKIKDKHTDPILKRQIHDKSAIKDQSGMICSGEQLVAFYFLDRTNALMIERILKDFAAGISGLLRMDQNHIGYDSVSSARSGLSTSRDRTSWAYSERIGVKNVVYIVGGGHVSVAFSNVMKSLDFRVVLIDDRAGLNTFVMNKNAHAKHVVPYEQISRVVKEGDRSYVVLMTFGYRTDDIVVRQLLGKKFRYLGMLGSKEKVRKLVSDLLVDGYNQSDIDELHAPIGVSISSKTPMEIAISIAAEIVSVKNRTQ